MERISVTKVFTPSSPASKTFIERENKINNHVVDALNTPGKQLVLYGHSGCGKTTLLVNKLEQLYEKSFITRCMEGMTYENLIIDGFNQLNPVYTEKTSTKGYRISPEITISYQDIKASFKLGEVSKQTSETTRSILPPQLTGQRLATFFGASKSCWILEDFHRINEKEKGKITQLLKVFMDMSGSFPELKMVLIGAVGTARQVVRYNSEMANRITEIFIPYMSSEEIQKIITSGEALLNLIFSKEVKHRIVKYACGLPAVCHQICLNICFEKNINFTVVKTTSINMGDLDKAVEKYINEKSDTLKAEYDKAIKIPNNINKNLPKEILRASLKMSQDEFSVDDIYHVVKNKRISKKKCAEVTTELSSSMRSEILVYDENSNLYRFNNLFSKAYTQLRLKDNDSEDGPLFLKIRSKIVDELLNIIDKEYADSGDSDNYEDEYGSGESI